MIQLLIFLLGDTAVFMYQVPQATFVPASITSLGRTTFARTVSYLVLESPATDVTEFHCTFRNTSLASVCTGSLSITSSLDLNSVTVELVTTNMTFEVYTTTVDAMEVLIIKILHEFISSS